VRGTICHWICGVARISDSGHQKMESVDLPAVLKKQAEMCSNFELI